MHNDRKYPLKAMFVGILLMTASAVATAQIEPEQLISQNQTPSSGVLANFFVETGVGYAALPRALIQFGDPTVSQVPNTYGHTFVGAAGFTIWPRFRLKFEYERITVGGAGLFSQMSNNPQNVGANGKLGLNPVSTMFAGEFDLVKRRRFDIFFGGGWGRTHVSHNFNGETTPIQNFTFPVNDRGSDKLWDYTGRAGIRYRLGKGLELDAGIYGKDSINGKCSLVLFPQQFISRFRGRP